MRTQLTTRTFSQNSDLKIQGNMAGSVVELLQSEVHKGLEPVRQEAARTGLQKLRNTTDINDE